MNIKCLAHDKVSIHINYHFSYYYLISPLIPQNTAQIPLFRFPTKRNDMALF